VNPILEDHIYNDLIIYFYLTKIYILLQTSVLLNEYFDVINLKYQSYLLHAVKMV
jgi:hypothetical protein